MEEVVHLCLYPHFSLRQWIYCNGSNESVSWFCSFYEVLFPFLTEGVIIWQISCL